VFWYWLRVKSGVHEKGPAFLARLTFFPCFIHHKGHTMTTITTTPSGLQYEDTVLGTGAIAKAGQHVKVHYTGWLFNDGVQGAKFDSSKDRGQPFQFALGAGQVIKGWDEGVQGMSVGGTRRLIIPADLGYGARGAGGAIPPNATLLFEVDFLG
jgi:FKBP-type peptidyl-prolyl cis-trans isomerase FkpA